MQPLIVRPTPLENENLHCYLMRLAQANGCPVSWIAELIERFTKRSFISYRCYHAPKPDQLRAIADLTLQPPDAVARLTMHRFAYRLNLNRDKQFIHHSAIVRYHHKDKDGMRFCPTCLREKRPWSVLWYFSFVTACLDHEALLVEKCPSCGRPVSYKSLASGQCDCGLAFVEIPAVHPGREGLSAQEAIQSRLTDKGEDEQLRRSAVWFSHLNSLQRVLDLFPPGSLAVDGLENRLLPGSGQSRSRAIENDYVSYTLAVNIVARGVDGFRALGERWEGGNDAHSPRRLPFENLYSAIEFMFRTDTYSRRITGLRAPFRAYVQQQALALRGERLLRFPPVLSGKQAARILGCSRAGVSQLIRRRALDGYLGPIDRKGIYTMLVETGSILRALRRRAAAIPLSKAADLAGIPFRALYELYLAGIVPAEYGPMSDGQRTIGIYPALVPALINAKSQIVEGHQSADWFDELREALQQALRGPQKDGYEDVFVEEPPDFDARDRTLGEPSGEEDGIPLVSAARRLGVTTDVIHILHQAGLLDLSGDVVHGVRRFLKNYYWDLEAAIALQVSPAALERWVEQGRISPVLYVGPRALYSRAVLYSVSRWCSVPRAARMIGCSENKVRSWIARGELRPVSGPRVNGSKRTHLLRSDIRALRLKMHHGRVPRRQ